MPCQLESACISLRSLLQDIGTARDEIDFDCFPPAPCDSVFSNLTYLAGRITPENAVYVSRFLRATLGKLPVDQAAGATSFLSKAPFKCPELNVHVYQPCRVSTCAFNTSFERDNALPWTRNCILNYRVLQQRDELELRELAFLYDRSAHSLRTEVNSVLASLRNIALTDAAEKEGGGTRQDVPEDVCSVCWGSIDGEGPFRVARGFVYCSEECFGWKSPITLSVERRFGLPAKRVLEISVGSFSTPRHVAHALGVNGAQLRELCSAHDVDLSVLQ